MLGLESRACFLTSTGCIISSPYTPSMLLIQTFWITRWKSIYHLTKFDLLTTLKHTSKSQKLLIELPKAVLIGSMSLSKQLKGMAQVLEFSGLSSKTKIWIHIQWTACYLFSDAERTTFMILKYDLVCSWLEDKLQMHVDDWFHFKLMPKDLTLDFAGRLLAVYGFLLWLDKLRCALGNQPLLGGCTSYTTTKSMGEALSGAERDSVSS